MRSLKYLMGAAAGKAGTYHVYFKTIFLKTALRLLEYSAHEHKEDCGAIGQPYQTDIAF